MLIVPISEVEQSEPAHGLRVLKPGSFPRLQYIHYGAKISRLVRRAPLITGRSKLLRPVSDYVLRCRRLEGVSKKRFNLLRRSQYGLFEFVAGQIDTSHLECVCQRRAHSTKISSRCVPYFKNAVERTSTFRRLPLLVVERSQGCPRQRILAVAQIKPARSWLRDAFESSPAVVV